VTGARGCAGGVGGAVAGVVATGAGGRIEIGCAPAGGVARTAAAAIANGERKAFMR
jgi:hypothetical protein